VAVLGVTNASPDILHERLDASFGAVSAGSAAPARSRLAAGASSNALGVALNTATAAASPAPPA
jgi:hypothetical protein